jgi:hypothetical protein
VNSSLHKSSNLDINETKQRAEVSREVLENMKEKGIKEV